MRLLPWLLLLCAGFGALPVCADRDIVYAARYYYPAGDHRTSHFHLYRINPNGTGRTQLTFGHLDEDQPQWSPDGRWILYDQSSLWRNNALFLIHAAGGHPIRLLTPSQGPGFPGGVAWSPDSQTVAVYSPDALLLIDRKTHVIRRLPGVDDFVWSPDGTRAYMAVGESFRKAGSHAEILTLRTGNRVPVPGLDATTWTDGHSALWAGNHYLIGVARTQKPNAVQLGVCDLTGHTVRVIACHWPPGASDPAANAPDLGAAGLLPGPAKQDWNLWVEDDSISSWHDCLYSRMDPHTGQLSLFAEGQCLAFSPDGEHFCISPHRETVNYAPGSEGTERQVWATPLQIGSVNNKRMKTITPGIVWVTDADWRKAQP